MTMTRCFLTKLPPGTLGAWEIATDTGWMMLTHAEFANLKAQILTLESAAPKAKETCEPPDGPAKLARYHFLKRRWGTKGPFIAAWLGMSNTWSFHGVGREMSIGQVYDEGWEWDSVVPDQDRHKE